jgi:hypothetical protein
MKRDKATDDDELRPEYHRDELKGAFVASTWNSTDGARIWHCWHRTCARRFPPMNP